MEHFIIPENYQPALSLHDTQVGIKTVKDFFQKTLSDRLNLLRVSAPLFVDPSSGLNDNLNGVERPVTFDIKESPDQKAEIVHSLAKWKRYALKKYGFAHGEGLYTDMVAIRRDEDTDNIHSIYVDQWDWEKIITREERNVDTLKDVVRTVYSALKKTEKYMAIQYDYIEEILPKDIFFITSQELEDMYPGLSPKDREYKIVKEKGAVFIMQIGKMLASGEPHDGRAPDYDDWELNGDIIVYYPVLDIALELSSMGIRVDEESLKSQLKTAGCEDRAELRLGDGLSVLSAGEVGTIVLAGVSAQTTWEIIEKAPWVSQPGGPRLVMVPATRHSELRRWLWEHGFTLAVDRPVQAAGRWYAVMAAEYTGEKKTPAFTECLFGRTGEWPEGEGYAAWQKAKLPRFRLGVPDGSLLAQEIDDLLAGLPR